MNKEVVNKELLNAQLEWETKCYKPLLEEYQRNEAVKGKLSCAFGFGVSEHYIKSDKKIMIVGQEANDHTFDHDKWGLECWQDWAVDYLNFQVYDEKSSNWTFKKNPSPFWQFFRRLKEEGFGVCWNNLDKVRRYRLIDGKKWTEGKLPYCTGDIGERGILNEKIFDGGKSLIEEEIKIAKSDIVIFVVGPTNPYYHALYFTFLGKDCSYEQILNEMKCPYPTKDEAYVRIDKYFKNLKTPVYYAYHPNYLSQSEMFENVIKEILKYKN